jgi:hypothetical protein
MEVYEPIAMSYKPQRKSNADLLTMAQKIDPSATAVDSATGEVTTTSTWDLRQLEDWAVYWQGPNSFETVSV